MTDFVDIGDESTPFDFVGQYDVVAGADEILRKSNIPRWHKLLERVVKSAVGSDVSICSCEDYEMLQFIYNIPM